MLSKETILHALRTNTPPDGIEDTSLGFWREVVVEFLSFDEASTVPNLLAADAKPWTVVHPYTEEGVLAQMREYMEFAWGKVENHRGISAGRSVEKIGAYIALLGRFDVLREMEEAGYAQYGAPKLAVACRAFDLPIPTDSTIQNMIEGQPCGADYECGCG